MRWSRNFCRGGGGGGRGRPDCQKTVLTTFLFLFFSPQLILLFLKRVSNGYFNENYNFPRFQRGANICQVGPTFSRGGGGGVKMPISIKTHITCDFPGGGVRTPILPLDPHMQLEIHSAENTNKITDVRALTCTTIHFIFNLHCFFIWWKNMPVFIWERWDY